MDDSLLHMLCMRSAYIVFKDQYVVAHIRKLIQNESWFQLIHIFNQEQRFLREETLVLYNQEDYDKYTMCRMIHGKLSVHVLTN